MLILLLNNLQLVLHRLNLAHRQHSKVQYHLQDLLRFLRHQHQQRINLHNHQQDLLRALINQHKAQTLQLKLHSKEHLHHSRVLQLHSKELQLHSKVHNHQQHQQLYQQLRHQ